MTIAEFAEKIKVDYKVMSLCQCMLQLVYYATGKRIVLEDVIAAWLKADPKATPFSIMPMGAVLSDLTDMNWGVRQTDISPPRPRGYLYMWACQVKWLPKAGIVYRLPSQFYNCNYLPPCLPWGLYRLRPIYQITFYRMF